MQFFAIVAIPPGYQNRFTISGTGSTGKRYTASLSQVAAINRNNLQELEIIIKVSKRLFMSFSKNIVLCIQVELGWVNRSFEITVTFSNFSSTRVYSDYQTSWEGKGRSDIMN
jgi:hypothetical protein